ncbi:hypothetical protein K0B03_04070 [Patescibacteria group bacterium]|nr:hypothetical protein [Patescibacteria group bacterium]
MKTGLNENGQILIEIILATLIGTMILGAAASLIIANQKSNQISQQRDVAIYLAQEGVASLKSINENNWHWIYLPPDGTGNKDTSKGTANDYCLKVDNLNHEWILTNELPDCDINVNGVTYNRKINIENVARVTIDDSITTNGGVDDPSSQKVTMTISYQMGKDIIIEQYLTRWRNQIFIQSNWAGGGGQADFTNSSRYDTDDGNIDTTGGNLKLKSL